MRRLESSTAPGLDRSEATARTNSVVKGIILSALHAILSKNTRIHQQVRPETDAARLAQKAELPTSDFPMDGSPTDVEMWVQGHLGRLLTE